eukprot:CAMPEP_0171218366 /NCGR_PEP_ID=MMETSP0790-20130122/33162_1 /TAXON_ID=2925 /ORGANISM="Alexandrium catenella, Strain OF101" /LENGTH=245 /DNA_ID=CAMNT_0011684181 /DNA_START=40 /DNA_END=774 /DNA_ORIENTATION=-
MQLSVPPDPHGARQPCRRRAAVLSASREPLYDVHPAAAAHDVAEGVDGQRKGGVFEALLLLRAAEPAQVARELSRLGRGLAVRELPAEPPKLARVPEQLLERCERGRLRLLGAAGSAFAPRRGVRLAQLLMPEEDVAHPHRALRPCVAHRHTRSFGWSFLTPRSLDRNAHCRAGRCSGIRVEAPSERRGLWLPRELGSCLSKLAVRQCGSCTAQQSQAKPAHGRNEVRGRLRLHHHDLVRPAEIS